MTDSDNTAKQQFKIGELAKRAGISQDTLRFYEKNALICASARSASGYRLYSNDDFARLNFILKAKQVGFSLTEIRELLALKIDKDKSSCQEVKDLVDEKLANVDARISELHRIRASLALLSQNCAGGPSSASHCSILEALAANEQTGAPQ
ncbi:Zn(2+)-responsive transcriptional regulator [Agaribacterium haliotis]|uniref:Zn(2+)-responsive transcriptional regulator n=1 Tax=Agaribacterium haliotis TaxID=2013869 RepID=UPI000BB57146|nr:Zn(2+)-responsive transcriptional regulator [Agaribacterium haliotis]